MKKFIYSIRTIVFMTPLFPVVYAAAPTTSQLEAQIKTLESTIKTLEARSQSLPMSSSTQSTSSSGLDQINNK